MTNWSLHRKISTAPGRRGRFPEWLPGAFLITLLSLCCILLSVNLSSPDPAGAIVNAGPGGNAANAPAPERFDIFRMDDAAFSAVIVSDLHYEASPPLLVSDLAPLQDRIRPITQTLLAETAAIGPDVLILCGDNLNGFDAASAGELAGMLAELEAQGIGVALCPGNHDYGPESKELWRECFSPLFHAESEDTQSLSYSRVIGGCRLLLMDDNYEGNGIFGRFSPDTLSWLEKELAAARAAGEEPVFVTHHNVFRGLLPEQEENYVVQNPELEALLSRGGVRLCLSGHRHAQEIIRPEGSGLCEIVSGFPSAAPFYFGVLRMDRKGAGDGVSLRYQAQSIDFARFGAPFGADGIPDEYQNTRNQTAAFSDAMDSILEGKALSLQEKEGIRELFLRFLDYQSRAVISEHLEEIRSDPMYHKMMMALKDTNYGPWLVYVMEHAGLRGDYLALSF